MRHILLVFICVMALTMPAVTLAMNPIYQEENTQPDEGSGEVIKEIQDEIDRLVGETDFTEWQETLENNGLELAKICNGDNVRDLVLAVAYGEARIDADSVFSLFTDSLKKRVTEKIGLVVALLGVGSVLSSALWNVTNSDLLEYCSIFCFHFSNLIVSLYFSLLFLLI